VTIAFTTNGLKDVKNFRSSVVQAIERGLPRDHALAAATTVPARLLGLSDRLGTIAQGKIANLTVTRGELFSADGAVRQVWVDGEPYESTKDEGSWKGNWTMWLHAHAHPFTVAVDKVTTVKLGADKDTLN